MSKNKIHIKKENRGKFTKAAKKRGMGVQEFARQVLANKERYSPTLIKRANFARNAAKWKKQGGGYSRRGQLQTYFNNELVPYYINKGYSPMKAVDMATGYLKQNYPEAHDELIQGFKINSPTNILPGNPYNIIPGYVAEGINALRGKDASLFRPFTSEQQAISQALGIENPYAALAVDLGAGLVNPGVLPKGLNTIGKKAVKQVGNKSKFKSEIDWDKALMQEYNAIESKISKLKEQEALYNTNQKKLWQDFKDKKITGEEYKKQIKEIQPWDFFENPIHALEKQLRELKVKQEIINTPQKNILKSESQLGKNISDGGTNNKGVFELGDNYVARQSAHGYDDASLLVNYSDKITSPRIMKTHQVKELNGKVFQVQDKATGVPYTQLSKEQLKNIPQNHIDNFYKDIAELEKNKLNIDISGGKSNIFYDSEKGFQFIDLGIGNMPDINDINNIVLKYKNGGTIGNNGMFDMTNPNIYKGLVPLGLGYGTAKNKKDKKYREGGYSRKDQLRTYFNNELVPYYISKGYSPMKAVDQAILYLRKNHPEAHKELIKGFSINSPTNIMPGNPYNIIPGYTAEAINYLRGKDASLFRPFTSDQQAISQALGVNNPYGAFAIDMGAGLVSPGVLPKGINRLGKIRNPFVKNKPDYVITPSSETIERARLDNQIKALTEQDVNSYLRDQIDQIDTPEGRKRLKEYLKKSNDQINKGLDISEDDLPVLGEDYWDKMVDKHISGLKNIVTISADEWAYIHSGEIEYPIGSKTSDLFTKFAIDHELQHGIQIKSPLHKFLSSSSNTIQPSIKQGESSFVPNFSVQLPYDSYIDKMSFKKNMTPLDRSDKEYMDYIMKSEFDPTEYYNVDALRLEREAFLSELRPFLNTFGYTKNRYDKVTPKMISDLRKDVKESDELGSDYARLLNITEDNDKNNKIISDALNKMPAVGGIGLGYGAYQNQKSDKYQGGGDTQEEYFNTLADYITKYGWGNLTTEQKNWYRRNYNKFKPKSKIKNEMSDKELEEVLKNQPAMDIVAKRIPWERAVATEKDSVRAYVNSPSFLRNIPISDEDSDGESFYYVQELRDSMANNAYSREDIKNRFGEEAAYYFDEYTDYPSLRRALVFPHIVYGTNKDSDRVSSDYRTGIMNEVKHKMKKNKLDEVNKKLDQHIKFNVTNDHPYFRQSPNTLGFYSPQQDSIIIRPDYFNPSTIQEEVFHWSNADELKGYGREANADNIELIRLNSSRLASLPYSASHIVDYLSEDYERKAKEYVTRRYLSEQGIPLSTDYSANKQHIYNKLDNAKDLPSNSKEWVDVYMKSVGPDVWDRYQEGGNSKNSLEYDLMSRVISNRNKNLNWVKRGLNPNDYPKILNKDGSYSTHKLAYSTGDRGEAYVYPTIIQNSKGQLEQLNIQDAEDHAIKSKTDIMIPNIKLAKYYSQNGLIKHKKGGYANGSTVMLSSVMPNELPKLQLKSGGGIPERYKSMGFSRVGQKKKSTRPGKKWMVLAKKGDQYKVVHGGYKGMKDYTQHKDKNRRKKFWSRMGGRDSSKAKDPFSPLYWHKRFGTWQDGGYTNTMKYQPGGPLAMNVPSADPIDFKSMADKARQETIEYLQSPEWAEKSGGYDPSQLISDVRRANVVYDPAKFPKPGKGSQIVRDPNGNITMQLDVQKHMRLGKDPMDLMRHEFGHLGYPNFEPGNETLLDQKLEMIKRNKEHKRLFNDRSHIGDMYRDYVYPFVERTVTGEVTPSNYDSEWSKVRSNLQQLETQYGRKGEYDKADAIKKYYNMEFPRLLKKLQPHEIRQQLIERRKNPNNPRAARLYSPEDLNYLLRTVAQNSTPSNIPIAMMGQHLNMRKQLGGSTYSGKGGAAGISYTPEAAQAGSGFMNKISNAYNKTKDTVVETYNDLMTPSDFDFEASDRKIRDLEKQMNVLQQDSFNSDMDYVNQYPNDDYSNEIRKRRDFLNPKSNPIDSNTGYLPNIRLQMGGMSDVYATVGNVYAQDYGINPALFNNNLRAEGFNYHEDEVTNNLVNPAKYTKSGRITKKSQQYPISGAEHMGLDIDKSTVNRLIRKGLLPESIKDKINFTTTKLEKGKKDTGYFTNIDDAFKVYGAVMKDRQDAIDHYASKEGVKLSNADRDAMTAYAYHMGQGNAKKLLNKYKKSKSNDLMSFIKDNEGSRVFNEIVKRTSSNNPTNVSYMLPGVEVTAKRTTAGDYSEPIDNTYVDRKYEVGIPMWTVPTAEVVGYPDRRTAPQIPTEEQIINIDTNDYPFQPTDLPIAFRGVRGAQKLFKLLSRPRPKPKYMLRNIDMYNREGTSGRAGGLNTRPNTVPNYNPNQVAPRYNDATRGTRGMRPTYYKEGGLAKSQKSLKDWTNQEWMTSGTYSNKTKGKNKEVKSKGKKRYLPKNAWASMSSGEKAATNRAKAEGNAKGKQFVKQPKEIAKKAARFRMEGGFIREVKDGGKIPKNILESRLKKHMSPSEVNDYLSKYKKGGEIVDYKKVDGGYMVKFN